MADLPRFYPDSFCMHLQIWIWTLACPNHCRLLPQAAKPLPGAMVYSAVANVGNAYNPTELVSCCLVQNTSFVYFHSVYLSNTRQALVPPKPKELDMTRETGPSLRLVRMGMPSASSTMFTMLADSARKLRFIMRSEYMASWTPATERA